MNRKIELTNTALETAKDELTAIANTPDIDPRDMRDAENDFFRELSNLTLPLDDDDDIAVIKASHLFFVSAVYRVAESNATDPSDKREFHDRANDAKEWAIITIVQAARKNAPDPKPSESPLPF